MTGSEVERRLHSPALLILAASTTEVSMKQRFPIMLVTVLSFVGGLWLAPVVSADDYSQWDSSERYLDSYAESDRDDLEADRDTQHNTLESRYERRMERLAEREQEALRRAYRKHDRNVADPRFQEQQDEIAQEYTRERNKIKNKFGPKLSENYEDSAGARGDFYEDAYQE